MHLSASRRERGILHAIDGDHTACGAPVRLGRLTDMGLTPELES